MVILQEDSFIGVIVVNIFLAFFFIISNVSRPAMCFLFYLGEFIDVVGREDGRRVWKMPYFMNFRKLASLHQSFFQFGGAPGVFQGSFCLGTVTVTSTIVYELGELPFHATAEQRKG